ncbi:MAG: cytochrome c [Devosiaceae bacterium]|nr:cytochrome c [Devosiaceae bacterium]
MIERIKQLILPILLGAVFIGGLVIMFSGGDGNSNGEISTANVIIPELSEFGQQGKGLFDANCAACHGENAVGTNVGPPLLHTIYNPGHHADEAFLRAAALGVQAHHWGFGNMPSVPAVDRDDILQIVRYVREMQAANGIAPQPHVM